MVSKVVEHLNKLTEAINEVKTTIEDETYGVDPGDTLAAPMLFLPLNMELKVQALESGTEEYDGVMKALGMLMLDFSKLSLAEVYFIQHAATTKLHIMENALSYQATKKKKKGKECKVLLKEKEPEIEAHE